MAIKSPTKKNMKTKSKHLKTAALAATLILGGIGVVQALEADTNATTVAYWKLGGVNSIALSPSGNGILDLATNPGQGTIAGTISGVPLSVQDLWLQGPLAASPTFASTVPPASMFNANNYFSAGAASWDCGADEFSGSGGSLTCDNITYGNNFNGPDFTWEAYFKSDTTNAAVGSSDPAQFLIFDHHQSAYAFVSLNDNPGDTNNIGSIRFWSWNVAVFGIDCRITAAQNHGQRLDDGHWHYVAARFNTATETMDLLVVNQDGTSTETSTYITVPLNPGGSGSQGPVFIGCDEGQNEPFNGLINQMRYSNVSLPNSELMANASACNAPVFNNTSSTNAVAVGSDLNLSAASWPVQVLGGPLQYQWQLNGANVTGQTNISLNLFPATLASAGTYTLVASTPCGGITATSAPAVVTVAQAIPVTRWSFESVEDVTYPQATVDDSLPGVLPSQGYDLITFNDATPPPSIGGNGGISLTNIVPPTSMFIGGNTGGTNSFDPSFISTVNGVVFYPAGPDVFDFQGSFSLELFFKTYGDQSASGNMELICQGSDGGNTVRYSVVANQAGPGTVSFHINNYSVAPAGPSFEDTNAGIQTVTLTNKNYADGNWHYMLAQYDANNNKIVLSIANADGTGTNASTMLPSGYGPLPGTFEGNLFVGRYRYPLIDNPQTDPRTFIGAIDEVQVSSGLITPSSGQLGLLPGAAVVTPVITGISVSGSTVTVKFTGSAADAATAFTLIGSPTVRGTYAALSATITSLGGGHFQATITKSGNAEFYKVQR
jgi:hypothetical protein